MPPKLTWSAPVTADAHFWWGSVMYGYLLYDTAYTLLFYRIIGSPSFLFHHLLGLASCWVGLYANRLAFFGVIIQVGSLLQHSGQSHELLLLTVAALLSAWIGGCGCS